MPIQNTQRNVFLMSIITENNHLQKKAAFMNEFPKRKVVEHNDLISSVAKMDKVPLKIFELAVSCIDTDNPPKDNIVFLSKRELFAFLMYQIAINIVVLEKRLKKCKKPLTLR